MGAQGCKALNQIATVSVVYAELTGTLWRSRQQFRIRSPPDSDLIRRDAGSGLALIRVELVGFHIH